MSGHADRYWEIGFSTLTSGLPVIRARESTKGLKDESLSFLAISRPLAE
jgi:hypothetical protein